MKQVQQISAFGRRKDLPTIILARSDKIHYFTIRPWLVAVTGSVFIVLALGYIAATAYLMLRDDLIDSTLSRQAYLQERYEDRIAALRAQVDRITSRQILEQQLMQRRMDELIERQEQLTRRHSRLGPVLERAGQLRAGGAEVPLPSPRPDNRARLQKIEPDRSIVTGSAFASSDGTRIPWPIRPAHGAAEADQLFLAINRSLRDLESDQLERIGSLAEEAYQTAEAISGALDDAGIPVAANYGEEDVGGPLLSAAEGLPFEEKVRELDEALSRLEELKQKARRIPIANPMPGAAVTSGFGVRRDPILGRPAHHSGVDFRAGTGAPVRAAGAGIVVNARWKGGYGRMVEIDHGDGISTRYAHLSKILVKEGAQVEDGAVVGRVGSSGRSTGPHLHYEVRRDGRALNPLKFISAGRHIAQYL